MFVERACALRRTPTDAETRLWSRLRREQGAGARFRRQVSLGPCHVDFLCPAYRPVVEVDGGRRAGRAAYDAARTRRLEAAGYTVLRFWNNEVLGNTDGVVGAIADWLGARTPRW